MDRMRNIAMFTIASSLVSWTEWNSFEPEEQEMLVARAVQMKEEEMVRAALFIRLALTDEEAAKQMTEAVDGKIEEPVTPARGSVEL